MLGMSLRLTPRPARSPGTTTFPRRSYFSSAGLIIGGAARGALALVGPYDASPQSQAIQAWSRSVAGRYRVQPQREQLLGLRRHGTALPLFILLVASPPARVPGAAFWLLAFAAFALIVRSLHTGREGLRRIRLAAFETTLMPHQAMVDNARAAIVAVPRQLVELCNRRFAEMMRVDERHRRSRLLDGFESRADWHHHAQGRRYGDPAWQHLSRLDAPPAPRRQRALGPRSPARAIDRRATRRRWSGWPST